jgi:hypothetical protein
VRRVGRGTQHKAFISVPAPRQRRAGARFCARAAAARPAAVLVRSSRGAGFPGASGPGPRLGPLQCRRGPGAGRRRRGVVGAGHSPLRGHCKVIASRKSAGGGGPPDPAGACQCAGRPVGRATARGRSARLGGGACRFWPARSKCGRRGVCGSGQAPGPARLCFGSCRQDGPGGRAPLRRAAVPRRALLCGPYVELMQPRRPVGPGSWPRAEPGRAARERARQCHQWTTPRATQTPAARGAGGRDWQGGSGIGREMIAPDWFESYIA